MTTQNDGGPAFPAFNPSYRSPDGAAGHGGYVAQGMSLRQWYAGMAMHGLVSNERFLGEAATATASREELLNAMIAAMAFRHADALIAHEQKERKV